MSVTGSSRAADRFLLECVRVLFQGAGAAGLADCLAKTDWDTITERALKHQFAGFLYAMQRQRVLPGAPPSLASRWKQEVLRQSLLQMVYQDEGARLLSGMAAEGFAPILLKGLAYMKEVFGDSAGSSVADMDILIRREDLAAVRRYLLQEGFVASISDFYAPQASEYERFQDEQNYEASFTKEVHGTQFVLDVHWHLGSGWPGYEHLGLFDLDRIPWRENTESFLFNGAAVRRLNPTAHFFHLVSHLALHHRFSGLKWLHGLCAFLSRYGAELDWTWIERYAGITGCRKVFGVTLRILAGILGPDDPAAGRWKEFWPRFLPGEYALLAGRTFREESQLMGAVCLLLLIARPADRFRLTGYVLFDPQGIPQLRLSPAAHSLPRRILQPFYLLGMVAAAGIRRRKSGENP